MISVSKTWPDGTTVTIQGSTAREFITDLYEIMPDEDQADEVIELFGEIIK